ncbi:MAG: hypothetical protein FWB99_13260 [Treponema sp.]|nr:hypothetical protein [Treponema sp.]
MNFPLYLKDLKEKLLPILANRTVFFFFGMCLLTIFLYAAGTVQGFVDATQFALLRLYVVLGIFLTATSGCAMFLSFGRLFTQKKARYLFRAGGYIILVVFGTGTVLVAMFILAMSEGNI